MKRHGRRPRAAGPAVERGGSARRSSPPPADCVALTADLLGMAVTAGLTPFLAVGLAARFGPEPAAGRLAAALAAAEGGLRLVEALEAEAERSPDFAPLAATLASGEWSGAAVAPALARLAAQTRAQARRRAMARARTVPVRLLFPLVFLVLPAFLLLTVAPVVLASLGH
ncbi:MAG: type II secretion system F family protein [Actinomycetota bacterium]|jgi:phosphotransferase system  glucose/maltose/N-acetylglucosamine-specific IIC component